MTDHRRSDSGWHLPSYGSFRRFLKSVADGSEGARWLELEGVEAVVAPAVAGRSLFNSVIYEHPDALRASLDEVSATYADAGVAAWSVWVADDDSGTREVLEGRGHELFMESRAMTFDLDRIPDPDDELEFTAKADWAEVCSVNDAAWHMDPGTFHRGMGPDRPDDCRAYGAVWQQWLAAVVATIDNEGDCGIHLVATLPEARRQRFAGRLLHRALLDARERGCVTTTVQASPHGAPLYARFGYQDLGPLEQWELRGAEA